MCSHSSCQVKREIYRHIPNGILLFSETLRLISVSRSQQLDLVWDQLHHPRKVWLQAQDQDAVLCAKAGEFRDNDSSLAYARKPFNKDSGQPAQM